MYFIKKLLLLFLFVTLTSFAYAEDASEKFKRLQEEASKKSQPSSTLNPATKEAVSHLNDTLSQFNKALRLVEGASKQKITPFTLKKPDTNTKTSSPKNTSKQKITPFTLKKPDTNTKTSSPKSEVKPEVVPEKSSKGVFSQFKTGVLGQVKKASQFDIKQAVKATLDKTSINKRLFEAIKKNQLEEVKKIIESPFARFINKDYSSEGLSFVHVVRDTSIYRLLSTQFEWDVELKSSEGKTLLNYLDSDNIELVKEIISEGKAQIGDNLIRSVENSDFELAELYIEQKQIDLNLTDKDGQNIFEILTSKVRSGRYISKDIQNSTLIRLYINLLYKKPNFIETVSPDYWNLFYDAIKQKNNVLVHALVFALEKTPKAYFILERNSHFTDGQPWTPLQQAVKYGFDINAMIPYNPALGKQEITDTIFTALEESNLKTLEALKKLGWSFDITSRKDQHFLQKAVEKDHQAQSTEFTEFALKELDLKQKDQRLTEALKTAISLENIPLGEILIRSGGSLYSKTSSGEMLVNLATQTKDTMIYTKLFEAELSLNKNTGSPAKPSAKSTESSAPPSSDDCKKSFLQIQK